ncbi:MAG: SNF2-related protein [Pseudonocardiaceae bacterium]
MSGLFLDEAQFTKNHPSKVHQCARRLPAPFKLAITGTPMENNLMELWSLLSITAPGLFPSPTRFREMYARPIEKQADAEPTPSQPATPSTSTRPRSPTRSTATAAQRCSVCRRRARG